MNRGKWFIGLTLGFMGTALLFKNFVGAPLFENTSASAPMGIYVISPNQKLEIGDYVVVTSPISIDAPVNLKVGANILKQVRGYAGDKYTVEDDRVVINGKAFPKADKIYSYLPHLENGEFTVPEGYHLYLNDSPISFDSRYIGPVADEHIVHKVILAADYKGIDTWMRAHLPQSVYEYATKDFEKKEQPHKTESWMSVAAP